MEFNWLFAGGLFVASMALYAVIALYTVAVIKNQAFKAASMSLLSYALYAIGVVKFVQNKWYILPLAAGAFAGSYAIVKRESNNKNKKQKRNP